MVLLAPTVTAHQTLLEVCRAYAEPHDIVYKTTKTVCMMVRPKQSQGRYPTRVRLGNEELSFVEEFRYLGHVMTADCGDDKDVVKQFRRQNTRSWQYAGQDVLIITTSHIVTQFMDVLSGVILPELYYIENFYIENSTLKLYYIENCQLY